MNLQQRLLPTLKQMSDVEQFMDSRFPVGILLDIHIARLGSVMKLARKREKRLVLHADLIRGLQSDEAAIEFLCQEYQPHGIISTRAKAIQTAKRKQVLTVQRVFLLDTNALESSYKMIRQTQPDYIELLPGILPGLIREVKERTGLPILTGGFLRSVEDVEQALQAGAEAVTSSNRVLWEKYAPGAKPQSDME